MANAAYLRFGAAILAVAAAAVGVVVAVDLLRSVPGPTGASASSSGGGEAPATTTTGTAIAGGRIPTPGNPAFPAPPPGAVVLGREAGARALGVGIVPGSPRSLLRVSVLDDAGDGAGGLKVTARIGGARPVELPACGRGCYQAKLAMPGAARSLTVSLDGARYRFALPALRPTPPDGTGIVDGATTTWHGLKSLVWRERLAGSPTAVIHSVFRAVAPDRLSYAIDGGSSAVIIGETRWDRESSTAPWERSPQNPPVSQPAPFWARVADAHIIGTTDVSGRKAWLVSFFDPTTPAWFTATIDKQNHRTLRLRMTAAAHFMQDVYGPFNAPLSLTAPDG